MGGSIQHLVTPDTIFRVASITKMATALVMLRLAEAGLLALSDTVVDYLPPEAHVPALAGVTIRQLLSHTSGLRDTPAYMQAAEQGGELPQVLTAKGVRDSEPGETFAYSNTGYGLLGCVMETVTGKVVS